MKASDIFINADYAVGHFPGERHRYRVIEKCGNGEVLVRAVEKDGTISPASIRMKARKLMDTWQNEFELRKERKEQRRALERERLLHEELVQETLQLSLPAFRGINVTPEEIGIQGGPNTNMFRDLADVLEQNFDEHKSQTITVSLGVFAQIAARIKQLSQERTGATWIG